MKAEQEETRKGPWTEQEDAVLVNFVHLFGDRRWDFIAKVSGLNRTGKSCRLRWVNYLHPGLKREKMSLQEQRLVLELHAKWGNRWSRIARKLPGRTDNEIKNYWRTHMRKKAQEKKKAMPKSLSPSSSSSSSSSSITLSSSSSTTTTTTTTTTVDSLPFSGTGKVSFYDTGGPKMAALGDKSSTDFKDEKGYYSMDDIWKDIDMSEENMIKPLSHNYSEEGCNIFCPSMASPSLDYCWDSLWKMDDEDSKMFLPFSQSISCFEYGTSFFNKIG
ncbi:transcription factor MYB59 isoform X1 [Gossypium raimondii]|uniref:Uncharacterized protein n=2 Tax=Gossypium TaxID=3633 RepID=A0A0D2MNF8_GOSRA|nr:transcription factor MYB59 isoform X1 [Gossypium raimondii]KJB20172.1 hypothetical protein B456_003G136400 [Gossypium raimondii]MBA0582609.1 hypothetical protein [Gossypium raimondii]